MKQKLALLFITVLAHSWNVEADPSHFKFKLINANDGLSNNEVISLFKDSRGFLWIGTGTGVNRFDGTEIRSFRSKYDEKNIVANNSIRKIFEDPEGKIWVITRNGNMIYDPDTEMFSDPPAKYHQKYGLPPSEISEIIKDNKGYFWFIMQGKGLVRYDSRTGSSIYLRKFADKEFSLSSNSVSSVVQTSKGDYYVLHSNGILEKLTGETLEISERHFHINKKFKNSQIPFKMFIDKDDDLWIYAKDHVGGLLFFNNKDKSLKKYSNDNNENIRLNNNLITGVVQDSNGLIWISTDHGGINILNKKEATVSYIIHEPYKENGLVQNSINCLYKDDKEIIWIGTFKKGMNFYHENAFRFQHIKHPLTFEGYPYDDVNRFVEDKSGNLWIGTNGAGLLYYNRKLNSFKSYRHNPNDPNSLSSDVIVSLLMDKDDNLWIGTFKEGLNKFDGKKFTVYKHDENDVGSIGSNDVWELFEDEEGNLWIGTIAGGLNILDRKTYTFRIYEPEIEEVWALNYITAIEKDRAGNLWIGGSNGIIIIDTKTQKARRLVHDVKNPASLLNDFVLTILRDSNGNMWVGTQEGLSLYNENKNSFVNFTQKDGLPHHIVLTLLEDNFHSIWLSTSKGLSNLKIASNNPFDKANISIINYDELDGLQAKVFNENAAYKTVAGELIFGGINGFNIIAPEKVQKNISKPTLMFTDFQLFNKSIAKGEEVNGRVLLEKSLSSTRKIVLKPNENVFSIEFGAINFINPEKNIYKYKLEGFDLDWSYADNYNRKAIYTNLDAGVYDFLVISACEDGEWSGEPISMKFVVLAPFYRTKVAYGIYTLAILFIIFLTRRRIINNAKEKFAIEQERREAQQLHELDLMKLKFFTNISHEFRTPLALILAPVEKLLMNYNDSELLKHHTMIYKNARRLLNLVNQLLDFRKIEVEGIAFHPSEGNLIKFIEGSVKSFSDISEKKNIHFNFSSDTEEFYTSFDMDKMEKILFNLLSNAFKFTPEKGSINVRVDCSEIEDIEKGIYNVKIVIEDSGIGMSKQTQEKIFERFFREDVPSSLVNQGSGIGLAIVKEFVKVHNGTITVESEPGVGSIFTVGLPLVQINFLSKEQPQHIEIKDLYESEESPGKPGLPVVLIVEDSEDFRFYIKDNLLSHFKVIEAENGKTGWQKILSSMPDLIISDIMMPEMDGIDLCKKVKADSRTSHIPFVLLTAHTAEEQKLKGLDLGANDYITKPFNFNILFSRINNLINQKKLFQKTYEKKISVQTSEIEIISVSDKLIQNAIKVVEENMSDPELSVEFLSRELALSRVHLYKKMMELTGCSPVEFIRKIRLQRAAQLLEKSELTIAEIAYTVGFSSRKYLTKYFKDEYKVSPTEYLENRQKNSA